MTALADIRVTAFSIKLNPAGKCQDIHIYV